MNIARYHLLGIALLLAAPLTGWLQQRITAHAILFALAGIILLVTPEKIGLGVWRAFIHSLKRYRDLGWTLLYDGIFWLILIITSLLYGRFVEWRVEQLGLVQLEGAALLDPAIARQNITLIQQFFVEGGTGLLLTLLVLWLAYSVLSAYVYTQLNHKRATTTDIKRYLRSSAFLFATLGIVALILLAALKPEVIQYVMPLYIIIAGHFSLFINHAAATSKRARSAITTGLARAARIPQFIVPYAYIALAYLVFMIIVTVTTPYPTVSLVASATTLVLFASWVKIFAHEVLK